MTGKVTGWGSVEKGEKAHKDELRDGIHDDPALERESMYQQGGVIQRQALMSGKTQHNSEQLKAQASLEQQNTTTRACAFKLEGQ